MGAPAAKETVLIVDDEESQRHLLAGILRRDYEVFTAPSHETAMALVIEQRLDLALVDYRLAEDVGTRLLGELYAKQPRCIRFLVTAYADSQILQEAVDVGHIYRFLPKPVDAKFLRFDIQRALEHRRASEDLQRSAQLAGVGRLASSVCHDLRNCLMATSLVPNLIAMGEPEAVNMGLTTLRHAQQQMRDLTGELTALSRGSIPQYTLTPGRLQDLAHAAVELLRKAPVFANRQLLVDIATELPELKLSEAHCTRMLINLLRNAAEATESGGEVGVKIFRSGDSVVCEIWDNGSGIPADLQGRIFDPMFTTKGEAGLGLGLWSCRTAMQAHGGSLTFRSAPGKGTTFVATFPLS